MTDQQLQSATIFDVLTLNQVKQLLGYEIGKAEYLKLIPEEVQTIHLHDAIGEVLGDQALLSRLEKLRPAAAFFNE